MTASSITSVPQPDTRGIRRLEFRALGTQCVIQFRHPVDDVARDFLAAALDWLTTFEAKFSRFRPDSVISRINAAAGNDWVPVDAETEHLLDLAADLHRLTDGILDPTMLPLLRVWDWKTIHDPHSSRYENHRPHSRNYHLNQFGMEILCVAALPHWQCGSANTHRLEQSWHALHG